jgi:hypothetical protein
MASCARATPRALVEPIGDRSPETFPGAGATLLPALPCREWRGVRPPISACPVVPPAGRTVAGPIRHAGSAPDRRDPATGRPPEGYGERRGTSRTRACAQSGEFQKPRRIHPDSDFGPFVPCLWIVAFGLGLRGAGGVCAKPAESFQDWNECKITGQCES